MQENDFEKRLQQKMELLQVQPAEEVWHKIKTEVASNNGRRKRFVFFFLLAALLFTGLLLTDTRTLFNSNPIVNNSINNTPAQKVLQSPVVTDEGIKKENLPVKNQQQAGDVLVNRDALQHKQSAAGNTVFTPAVPSGKYRQKYPATGKKQYQAAAMLLKNDGSQNSHTTTVDVADQNKLTTAHSLKGKKKAAVTTTVLAASPEEIETGNEIVSAPVLPQPENTQAAIADVKSNITTLPEISKEVIEKVAKEAMVKVELTKENSKEEIVKQDKEPAIASGTKKQTAHPKKWGIALSFAVGRSSANINNMDKSLAADYTGNIGNSAGNPTGTPGNSYTPSSVAPGIAFNAAVLLYRTLSKKSTIKAGLQYQLLTNSNKTGARVDSLSFTREAYLYGNTVNHTNYYHYLSLPVTFSTGIFKIHDKQVVVDAGVSISKLLYTNALNFNAGLGTYFQDKTVFNKTIAGLSAAAYINLSPANRPALYIGPEFYYGLTPLSESGIYSKSHFSFLGIRLQKNLGK